MTDWFSDDKATFGDRLQGAREAAGMTQADLAHRLGVTAKTIRAWEDDMSAPRSNRLQIIAGLLNVSLMWLLNGNGEGVSAPEDDAAMPADISAAIGDLRQMRAEMDRIAERAAVLERRLQRWSEGKAA